MAGVRLNPAMVRPWSTTVSRPACAPTMMGVPVRKATCGPAEKRPASRLVTYDASANTPHAMSGDGSSRRARPVETHATLACTPRMAPGVLLGRTSTPPFTPA